MNAKRYAWYLACVAGLTLIVFPVMVQTGLAAMSPLWGVGFKSVLLGRISPVLGLLLLWTPLALGFWFGKRARLPEGFMARYLPFLAPLAYVLLAWIVVSAIHGGDFTRPSEWLFVPFLPFAAYLGVAFIALLWGDYWIFIAVITLSQAAFTGAFALGTRRSGRFATRENRARVPALSLVTGLALISGLLTWTQYHSVFHEEPRLEVQENIKNSTYWLFHPDNLGQFVRPRQTPSLRLESEYPRLDGAIALLPVYGAAAQAIYAIEKNGGDAREEIVQCTNTPSAYRRLIDGETDMIFAAAPSEAQKRLAAERGLTLNLTPIAKEAFVFLAHEKNPVKDLSVDQIRAIYSGEIDDWSRLGGAGGKILAFQRNPDSGSQATMERSVMRGQAMRKPLEAEYKGSMGGILRAVADYRNYPDAIGYSFRYYATAMNSVPGVVLLSVNGVAPTAENIRNGTYPFISDAYIVTARPLSENAVKLRDWFLSDEGQQLIADVGYVPIREAGI